MPAALCPPSNLIGANGFAVEDQSQGRRGLCAVADATGGLKLRKTQEDRDRERNAKRWRDTGLVFTTRYGTPIEPRNFDRSFNHRIEQAKVRRITVHGTRETCGTLPATLDVHSRIAMQILRHSKISVTMEIYTEATSEATRDALKRLSYLIAYWRGRPRFGVRQLGFHAICCPLTYSLVRLTYAAAYEMLGL